MAKKVSRPKHTPPAKAQEQEPGKKGKQFDNTNRGALFANDKQGNENRPDFTGIVDIEIPEGVSPGDIVKFRLAGWEKTAQSSGDTFLSLQVQKADTQGGNGQKKGGFVGKKKK